MARLLNRRGWQKARGWRGTLEALPGPGGGVSERPLQAPQGDLHGCATPHPRQLCSMLQSPHRTAEMGQVTRRPPGKGREPRFRVHKPHRHPS